jgi:hypothetical protein
VCVDILLSAHRILDPEFIQSFTLRHHLAGIYDEVVIDDFVVTFFVKGPGADTLPVVIYSMIKKSREFPVINALSTLLLLVTFGVVWASQRLTSART